MERTRGEGTGPRRQAAEQAKRTLRAMHAFPGEEAAQPLPRHLSNPRHGLAPTCLYSLQLVAQALKSEGRKRGGAPSPTSSLALSPLLHAWLCGGVSHDESEFISPGGCSTFPSPLLPLPEAAAGLGNPPCLLAGACWSWGRKGPRAARWVSAPPLFESPWTEQKDSQSAGIFGSESSTLSCHPPPLGTSFRLLSQLLCSILSPCRRTGPELHCSSYLGGQVGPLKPC